MTYKSALIIGRFQPFHKGHVYLLEESFKLAEKVIIGIGSVNVDDENNPYSQIDVEKMINNVLSDHQWKDRVIQIIGIPDFHDDSKWLGYINKNCLPFDVVISNNDWVTNIFKKINKPIIEIPLYRRELYEGWRIRKLMREGGEWKSRVPDNLDLEVD